jgi:RHS repeat-associated protein
MTLRRRLHRRFVIAMTVVLVGTTGAFDVAPVQAIGGGPVQYTYDADGRLSGVIDPTGASAAYSYDATGNVTSIIRKTAGAITVLEVTPDRGAVGASVTIEGTGFSATPAQNTVKFNGTTATVTSASTTKLITTVPAGATTGAISVTAPSGTANSPTTFSVGSIAPTISGFTPNVAASGDTITITGTNFDTLKPRDVVAVSGVRDTIASATATSLSSVLAPSGSGKVQVVTAAGVATSSAYLFVAPTGTAVANIDSTGVVVVDTPQTVTIPTGKTALRVFEGVAGQHLNFTMPGLGTMVGGYVIGPDGMTVAGWDGGPSTIDIPPLPRTGTYTLKLQAFYGNPGGTLSLATVAPDVSMPIVVGGASVPLTFTSAGQFARLTFAGTAGQRVIVNGQTTGSWFCILSLRTPDDIPIATTGLGVVNPLLEAVTLPETGTYTILVDPAVNATGQITISVYNDPGDAQLALTLGTPVPFPAFVAGQNIAATFAGTVGERVSVDVSTGGAYSATLTVRNPDGSTLESMQAYGWFFEPVALPATGTYTIYIDPYAGRTGPGTVAAYDVPPDSSGTITINGPTVNVPISPGQQATLTFGATAGQVISLTTTPGGAPNLSITDPDGNTVWSPTGSQTQPFVTPTQLSVTGTYTILIDPSGATQGTFGITLYAVPPDDTGTMSIDGPPATVTNTAPGQNMSRTFSGTSGQRVSLVVTALSGTYPRYLHATIQLLRPDATTLWTGQIFDPQTDAFMEPVTLPSTGTYTITVDPNYETVVSYRLTLPTVPADDNGTIVVGGASVTATNTVPGQNMRRTFACTNGQKVKLVASAMTFGDGEFDILNPGGTWVGGSYLFAPGGTVTATISGAGTCTITVDPSGAELGSATLTLTNNPGGSPAASNPRPQASTPSFVVGDASGFGRPPALPAVPTPAPSNPPAAGGTSLADHWDLTAKNLAGDWRVHLPASAFESMPLPSAPSGVTGLSGRVLTIDGQPLQDVTVHFNSHTAITDSSGRFLLTPAEPGHGQLVVDGTSASRPNHAYGLFEIGVDVADRVTTKLPYTIWMTALDTKHVVAIPAKTTTEVVVTTPAIPGLELHIPAGSRITDEDGQPVTSVGITAIPLDRPPFPLPANTEVPIYFTIQPGMAYVAPKGAWIVYPNYNHLAPGTRTNFWQYDPDTKGWYVYGHGTVSADGRQVLPDAGVRIWEFTGAMFSSGDNPPDDGSSPDGDSTDGDPVDISTGLFVLTKTDLVEPGPLAVTLTRTYRQNDTQQRAFGIGTNFNYGFFLWSAHQYTEVDLVLPDGGRVHFVRTSPGTGWVDAIFRSTATPGRYYGAWIYWNGQGWDVRLRDGTVFVFADNGPVQLIRDRYGNTINLIRVNGRTGPITRIQSSSGRWINLGYDVSNRITSATDALGRTATYEYDAAGYLWKVTDPNGGVTEYTYDTAGRMHTLKDARGITFLTNDYDANGRVQTQTQADSTTFGYAYVLDGNGKVSQVDVTDPRGFVRRVTYNATGYTLTDTSAFGTALAQTTTFVRQSDGNLTTSMIDALGRRTDTTYDFAGNPITLTRLAGTQSAITTTATYEPRFGQIATQTDPLTHTTTYSYDVDGRLQRITDARSKDTTITSNSAGQPLAITDPTGKVTTSSYLMGDLVAVTDPLNHTTTTFVDSGGRTAGSLNSIGSLRRVDYDPLNRPTTIADPLGGATSFTYDPNGNILTVTDAHGGVTTSTYDTMDRPATHEDPLHRVESDSFDAAGHPIRSTDRNGKVTEFGYDALGRQTLVGYGAVTVGGTTTYESTVSSTFDAGNRLRTEVDSASGTTTYNYDDLDRITSEASPQGSVTYAYDNASRRTRLTLAGQPDVIYAYDNADRLTTITQGTDQIVLTYDDAGRRLTMTLPGSIVATYSYDDATHVTGITYKKGSTTIGDLTYTYNADGRKSIAGGSLAGTMLPPALSLATYDAANELRTWDGTTLTYDANGSLAQVTPVAVPDTQAPTVPTGVGAAAVGPKQVNVTWSPSSDNIGVTRYAIYRGGVPLTSVAGGVTSFTDWSVAPSTAYSYTVSAADAAGNTSAQSTSGNVTTPAAGTTYASDAFNRTLSGSWGTADIGGAWSGTDSTFSVTPGAGKVTLSSATNKNANLTSVSARDTETLVKLNVNKLASGGTTVAWVALRRQSSSTYYSAQVTFNTNQTIGLSFVRTSNNTNTTIGSGTASPTHAITDSYWLRIQISGTTQTNGKLRLWKDGTTEPTTWTVNSTDNSTPTALRGNGHVGVRFQKSGSGGLPVVGSFSSFALTTIGGGAPQPDTTAPSIPTGLSATAVSSTRVNLAWAASTDNVGVQGYRLYRNGSLISTVGSTTWSDTGLSPNTAYSYAVAAIDGAGNASVQSTTAGVTTLAAAAVTTYAWNARNELTQIQTGGVTTASFAYDVAGRRISRTLGGTATGFAYGGVNAIQETSGATPTANMLTGGVDQLFRRTDATGTRYPLTDDVGSIVALADAAGAIKTSYTYGPFGDTSASGEPNANPSQFTGRENDGTGLYFYRARYYSPAFGRFISEDPAGLAGSGPNPYLYAADDPINSTDPSGKFFDTIVDVGFVIWDLWNIATGDRKHADENIRALGMDLLGMVLPGVTGLGILSRSGRAAMEAISKLGREGELLAGIVKNTEKIASLTGTATKRFPDVLDKTNKIIGEVKNVKKLGLTKQLQDYLAHAAENGYTFRLYIRENTVLTKSLQDALDAARLEGMDVQILRILPGK